MALQKELDLDRPFEDLYHEAVLSIVRTASILSGKGAKIFRQFGLTEAQFNVLFALKYKTRAITQSELGKRLVVTRATITSVLDNMEQKGLVERKNVPSNRRIHHVDLTAAGTKLIEEAENQYRKGVHYAMGSLSEAENRQLIGFLERIRKHVYEINDDEIAGLLA